MNLIICYTPLQVVIAEKIIALYPQDKFYGILVGATLNDKYKYYFSRLQQHCHKSKIIIEPKILSGKLRQIYYYLLIRKLFPRSRAAFSKVFISNLEAIFLRLLVSHIKFDQLMTFDDGLSNILPGTLLYQPDDPRIKHSWPNKNSYSKGQLRQLSSKHYSIYPGYENIVSPVEAINLMPPITRQKDKNSGSVNGKIIRIFLGQPLLEDGWQQIVRQILARWQIENYLPHPREDLSPEGVHIIKTELIFEEYLIKEIAKSPETQYEIYSAGSSAMLNVMHFPNVTLKLIHIIGAEQQLTWYKDLLQLIADLQIETLTFCPETPIAGNTCKT